MSITRRCDYACRIIRAAYRSGDTYISIAEVAEQESIPYSFAQGFLLGDEYIVNRKQMECLNCGYQW